MNNLKRIRLEVFFMTVALTELKSYLRSLHFYTTFLLPPMLRSTLKERTNRRNLATQEEKEKATRGREESLEGKRTESEGRLK